MTKISNKYLICLLVAMSFSALTVSANELNSLDIRKNNASASSINVTIYTSSTYNDNVAVTKKSDNKYVILMPNVSGENSVTPDFSSLKDVISDVSIKSLKDGAEGYTKVTLTTTKPVTITTTTKKTIPLTAEQKAYKNLIAQSRGYTPAVKVDTKSSATTSPKPSEQVNQNTSMAPVAATTTKVSLVDTLRKKTNVSETPKTEDKNNVKQNSDTKISDKNIEQNSAKQSNTNLDAEKSQQKNLATENSTQEVAQEQLLNETVTEKSSVLDKSAQENSAENITPNNTSKGTKPDMATIFTLLISLFAAVAVLLKGIKQAISISHSSLKNAMKEQLNLGAASVEDVSTDFISLDSSLSWQDKYKKYVLNATENTGLIRALEASELTLASKDNNSMNDNLPQNNSKLEIGHAQINDASDFAQSAKPKPLKANKLTSYNKPAQNSAPENIQPIKKIKNQELKLDKISKNLSTDAPKKLKPAAKENKITAQSARNELNASLERTLHNSPSVERLDAKNDAVVKQINDNLNPNKSVGANFTNPSPAEVNREEEQIDKAIRKSPKLKSFANKVALEETRRSALLPKHRSEIIKAKNTEKKYVNLEQSSMYSNARNFDNANLRISDLLSSNSNNNNSIAAKTPQAKTELTQDKPYSMTTIDEFFDAVDSSSKMTAPATLSSRVADRLGKMSSQNAPASSVNTKIDVQKSKRSDVVFAGKRILSGYTIDKKSGIFIVSDKSTGKYSLIGQNGNKIVTLASFDNEPFEKLQVRRDEQDVYMVRVGSSRFLVEMSDEKMGVLLEI